MTDTPTLWRDMTPEEKGALLLADHEGKVIEVFGFSYPDEWCEEADLDWHDDTAYRIKRETVTAKLCINEAGTSLHMTPTGSDGDYGEWCHYFSLIFDTIYGKPDPASIKIEEL